jgi:hypothetical protein
MPSCTVICHVAALLRGLVCTGLALLEELSKAAFSRNLVRPVRSWPAEKSRNREALGRKIGPSSAASALLLLRLPARPPVKENGKMKLLMAIIVEGLLSLLLDVT